MEKSFIFLLFLLIILESTLIFAAAPTFDTIVIAQSSYNPTENSTTTIRIDFNVTDLDGTANLNNSACKCEFDNSAVWSALYENATDISCDNQTIDADTVQYTCLVPMQYWYENNTYSANLTLQDNETTLNNASTTFTYTLLIASVLDTTIVNFGTITSADFGTNKTDANSPTTVTNTGNKPLTLKITGDNLIDSNGISANLNISQFSVKNESSFSGALQLTTLQQTIPNTLVPVEDATPGDNTEDVWWFFSVPNPFLPGTYSGTWTLTEE